MGRKLPGSPIVGYFNKDKEDFEGHNRELIIEDGKFEIVDVTRPYGFVPTDTDVWFEKFLDDGVEHEYLCCQAYIWTGVYPESKRMVDKGNNQSMELDTKLSQGFWTNSEKTHARIFIYNEVLIQKLCALGEEVEPCFEGSQIASHFSLDKDPEFIEFKRSMFSILQELQENLKEGGSHQMEEEKTLNPEIEESEGQFVKKPDEQEDKKDDKQVPPAKEGEGSGSESDNTDKKDEEDKKKKESYSLDEVVEYKELLERYNSLNGQYEALKTSAADLEKEVASLREFKVAAQRKDKEAKIAEFYMLNDEDKKDVIEHIDTYSLEDIEAKLSVICFRNKVNFSLGQEDSKDEKDDNPQGLFNLNQAVDSAPEWIKAIRQTANKQ